jgi:hypothetical protein
LNLIKNVLVIGLILSLFTGIGSAVEYFIYDGSGTDTFSCSCGSGHQTLTKVSGAGSPFYIQFYHSMSGTASYIPAAHQNSITIQGDGATGADYDDEYSATYIGESLHLFRSGSGQLYSQGGYYWWDMYGSADSCSGHRQTVVCSDEPFEMGISGDTCGVDNVTCYINTTGDYIINGWVDLTESAHYEFDVANETNYKLIFGDGHEYEFLYNGTPIVYNYDICECITMNFYDRCETPVKNLQLFYWTTTYSTVMSTIVDGSVWEELVFGNNVEIGDTVYIIPIWYDGTQKYTFTASESPMQMDITNIPITYEMGVKTVTEAGAPISGVQVSVSQSCAYDGTKNKVTSEGWAWFTGCSNTGGSLTVSKSGYKSATMPFPTLMATAWQYRTSYIISMAIDGSANDTSGDFNDTIIDISEVVTPDQEYDLDNNNEGLHDGVEIWFTNENGNRCTKISDTDTYVDLWFVNKNSNESSMILEFQESYTGNYYYETLNWSINYNKFGFKRIYNIDFIPYYFYYRGKIYNNSLSQWDRIRHLDVRNETKEEEEHYENLSTCIWFRHATVDHKIDYRNDIEIVCNAASNNTTLLDLDIELYNGSILVDYINLTWADFSGASIKWFYIWEPNYDYASGYNYTTKMIGYNGYVLRTDHVDCFTDDRKNKLTIGVKDKYGDTLNNCYIYLENWGSLPTGNTYYNAYEGIDNGDYRYKASKSGYSSAGWDEVNLTDEDKIVWYVLSEDYTNTSIATTKFTDDDIKGFFFPLMFFLLICIILGGLKYVTN